MITSLLSTTRSLGWSREPRPGEECILGFPHAWIPPCIHGFPHASMDSPMQGHPICPALLSTLFVLCAPRPSFPALGEDMECLGRGCWIWSHLKLLRDHSWQPQGKYELLRIESRSAMCKAFTFPAGLYLWSSVPSSELGPTVSRDSECRGFEATGA